MLELNGSWSWIDLFLSLSLSLSLCSAQVWGFIGWLGDLFIYLLANLLSLRAQFAVDRSQKNSIFRH